MGNFIGKSQRGPWLAAALAAVLLGATPSPPRAAEPTPPPPPQKKLTFRDILLTVHARTALADDPVLGPANLGVRVQDNVAVLWGPVPSEEVRRRAVNLVKKVKGVFDVRDAEVYVAAPPPPVVPMPVVHTPPLPPPTEGPTRTESDSPDPVTGTLGALTAKPVAAPTVLLGAPTLVVNKAPARTVSAAPLEDLAAALLRRAPDRSPLPDGRLPRGRRRRGAALWGRPPRRRDGVRAGHLPPARPGPH